MKKEIEVIEMDEDFDIPFISSTHAYGRAEFTICPIWRTIKRRRVLIEVIITPKQQNTNKQWRVKTHSDSINLSSYHVSEPHRVWLTGWCRDHKTQFMHIYVPGDSNILKVQRLSSFCLTFVRL